MQIKNHTLDIEQLLAAIQIRLVKTSENEASVE